MSDDNSFDVAKLVFSPTIAGYYVINGVDHYLGKTSEWNDLKSQLAAAQEEIERLKAEIKEHEDGWEQENGPDRTGI